MNTILADGLRGTLQDLNNAIAHSRTCIRKDHPRKAEFLSEYLLLVRRAHDLREDGIARRMTGELFEPHMPMPFAGQVMGLTKLSDAKRVRRQWAGFCWPTPIETTAPVVVRKIAA
jgi:hypothetical protein